MFLKEMLANYRMFLFPYTLIKLVARVSYIICITQLTLKFIYTDILAVECCILFCTWNRISMFNWTKKERAEMKRMGRHTRLRENEDLLFRWTSALRQKPPYYYVGCAMQYWGITISSPSAGTRCDWLSCVDFTRVVIWFIKTTWSKQKSVCFT